MYRQTESAAPVRTLTERHMRSMRHHTDITRRTDATTERLCASIESATGHTVLLNRRGNEASTGFDLDVYLVDQVGGVHAHVRDVEFHVRSGKDRPAIYVALEKMDRELHHGR